jgi:antitoxin component of MazEF toxin-antitoxin module
MREQPRHSTPEQCRGEVGLKAKDDFDIEIQDGNVVLKPHRRRLYRLEDLVRRITPKHVYREIAMHRARLDPTHPLDPYHPLFGFAR